MSTNRLLSLYILFLLSLLVQASNLLDYPISSAGRMVASPRVSASQCTYGGGLINNSTVIEMGNCEGLVFYVRFALGTPNPQAFNFQFDTGSGVMWVLIGSSPSGFNNNLSKTFSYTNYSKTLTYGDGSWVNGVMGNDFVTVPGTQINVNNSIQWITNHSDGLFGGSSELQGLVGMDYASYPNFLDVAYQKGQISTPVFALEYAKPNQTAYLYYNNGLPQSILEKMTWIPQQAGEKEFWQAPLGSVTADGVNLTTSLPSKVVFDSGAALVVFSTNFYNYVIQKFFSTPECFNDPNTSNLRTCYCNGTWPEFVFRFSSTLSLNMSGDMYKYANSKSGFCSVLIRSIDLDEIVLGSVFFRGYIIQFDRLKNVMGFYDKAANQVYYSTFYPKYFAITQYAFCGAAALLAAVGIGLYIHARRQVK